MKTVKLGVLICGALGITGLLLIGIEMLLELDRNYAILMVAAFALPMVMSVLALVKPPFRSWQAGVALAGFAVAAWKVKIWEVIRGFADTSTGGKLLLFGAGLGVILSVIAVMNPEDGA